MTLSMSHVGLWVTDLPRMERFYVQALGYHVTDRGVLNNHPILFLSQNPAEHHELVLAEGRPADAKFSVVNQISLRAPDLAGVRAARKMLAAGGASEVVSVTHGNAVSVYAFDPEGNRVEVFIDTPWYVSQPCRIAVDLDRADDVVWAEVRAISEKLPGFKPRDAWESDMRRLMKV